MKYTWLDDYCLSKKGAVKDFKEEWNAYRYLLTDKMFGMLGHHKDGRKILTVKCEPSYGIQLRDNYPDIIPGYYMNKLHWNSVYLDGNVPDETLKKMIDMSYELVFNSLSLKIQQIIKDKNN
ncbi:MAG: MmcQ/YjbR family DNA-binding protein [Spirochaetes bacterium]|nr:MmcQ/YjbR family DNA-binding protein [Spirochaetota bacterium]